MNKTLMTGLASALAISTAVPAAAQYGTPYRPTQQYQQDLRQYQDQQAQYQYQQADYAAARRDYERRRDDWERARAAYDARWGYGAYARRYGPAPAWDQAYWDRGAPSAGYYGANASAGPAYASSYDCRADRDRNATVGSVLGALAGAALGSNVAASKNRTEGAVLGALVGGGVGLGIGRATAKCDNTGYFYSYDQTVPYRESSSYRGRPSGTYNYTYYDRQRCRLAPAPANVNGYEEYRYVRVCPDEMGRYRITG